MLLKQPWLPFSKNTCFSIFRCECKIRPKYHILYVKPPLWITHKYLHFNLLASFEDPVLEKKQNDTVFLMLCVRYAFKPW